MLLTRAVEVILWEEVLPPEVLRLPDELARVDALLDDPAFFVPFVPSSTCTWGVCRQPSATGSDRTDPSTSMIAFTNRHPFGTAAGKGSIDLRDVGRRRELRQRVVVGGGQGTTRVAGVHDSRRLDEQRVDFPIRGGAVLDTSRYDEQLAGAEPHVAVAQLNGQLTSNDDEQLIGVVVGVPDELTLYSRP
jgi:hypothetical protein